MITSRHARAAGHASQWPPGIRVGPRAAAILGRGAAGAGAAGRGSVRRTAARVRPPERRAAGGSGSGADGRLVGMWAPHGLPGRDLRGTRGRG